MEPHIPKFAEFERWKGKDVLELGCGIGTAAIEFAKCGAHVRAIDISEKSIAIACKRATAEGLSIFFSTGNIEDVRLGWDVRYRRIFFDLVYSFGVIHHTPDPLRAARAAHYSLKPGGEFRLMLYNNYSWKAFWILAKFGKLRFWKWNELIAKHSEAQTGCPITRTYTRKSARKLLVDSGFEVESISVDHIFPYRIPDYIQYRYVKEWYWRWMPKPLFRLLERSIGWHMLIKARKL